MFSAVINEAETAATAKAAAQRTEKTQTIMATGIYGRTLFGSNVCTAFSRVFCGAHWLVSLHLWAAVYHSMVIASGSHFHSTVFSRIQLAVTLGFVRLLWRIHDRCRRVKLTSTARPMLARAHTQWRIVHRNKSAEQSAQKVPGAARWRLCTLPAASTGTLNRATTISKVFRPILDMIGFY